ncbi:hypothetical protein AB6A23_16425 [Paenibacillus tarimensis]
MDRNDNQEIPQRDIPEIEQTELPEFEQSTPHPNDDNTQVCME